MRVSSSTVNCPFYCFSPPPQPPPAHCQPCALESKDAQNSSCRSSPCSLVVEEKLCDEKIEISANGADGQKIEVFLKSSLRKKTSSPKEMGKDRIKWMDDLGKELVEIREFDPIYFLRTLRNGKNKKSRFSTYFRDFYNAATRS